MDEIACVLKELKLNKVLFYVYRPSGKKSRELTSPDSVSEKITQDDQSALIRREVVRRNYSEQNTEKQIRLVLKLARSPQKR